MDDDQGSATGAEHDITRPFLWVLAACTILWFVFRPTEGPWGEFFESADVVFTAIMIVAAVALWARQSSEIALHKEQLEELDKLEEQSSELIARQLRAIHDSIESDRDMATERQLRSKLSALEKRVEGLQARTEKPNA